MFINAVIRERRNTHMQATTLSSGIVKQLCITYIPIGYPIDTNIIGRIQCIDTAELNHRTKSSVYVHFL